jgi:hypothetical protein
MLAYDALDVSGKHCFVIQHGIPSQVLACVLRRPKLLPERSERFSGLSFYLLRSIGGY